MTENFEIMELWRYIATQWRIGLGGAVGLDYNSMFAVAGILEIQMTPEILSKIRILEYKTLSKLHSK